MNNNISQLYKIATKQKRRILGLMSGTSLDGLDLAFCEIEGNGMDTKLQVIAFDTIPYTTAFRNKLEACCFKADAKLEDICQLNMETGRIHAGLINDFLSAHNISRERIDAIASHGQTFFHAPATQLELENGEYHQTLQLGDGDHIALLTGIITISDFRQKHVAAGGEGAPLVPYGELILFAEKENDVILINIGGISNFSFFPSANTDQDICFGDIGPGNALMDAWMKAIDPYRLFDESGKMAESGNVQNVLLEKLLKLHESHSNTQSKGKETYHLDFIQEALKGLEELPPADVMASLSAMTARLITATILKYHRPEIPMKLYFSGGGLSNEYLMRKIMESLKQSNIHLADCKEKGINPNSKEAVMFAILANECLNGDPSVWKGISPAVSFGKISFPG